MTLEGRGPLWHERDISHSSVERVIAPDATAALDFALDRMAEVVDRLLVYPEAMRANLDRLGGLIHSQRVLLAITQAGMSREDAYRAVQRVAMPVFDGKGRFRDHFMVDKEVMRYVSPERLDARVRRYLSHQARRHDLPPRVPLDLRNRERLMAIDGTWSADMETPMGMQTISLQLASAGTTLTGKMSGSGRSVELFDGHVDGNKARNKRESSNLSLLAIRYPFVYLPRLLIGEPDKFAARMGQVESTLPNRF
jgi:Adenylosuccinate lyase C-terminus